MKFGYFDDVKREYVIIIFFILYFWINYFGMKDFLFLILNYVGGYCFYKDVRF